MCACVALASSDKTIGQPTEPAVEYVPGDLYIHNRVMSSYRVEDPLTVHASMYALAGKYRIESLAECALNKFKHKIGSHWNTEDFIEAVQMVSSSTPEENRGLRDLIKKTFREYFEVNLNEIPGVRDERVHIYRLSFLLRESWPNKKGPKVEV